MHEQQHFYYVSVAFINFYWVPAHFKEALFTVYNKQTYV